MGENRSITISNESIVALRERAGPDETIEDAIIELLEETAEENNR